MASHHLVLSLPLPGLSLPPSTPFLALGRLCQRSPRTVPVSLLRVGSTQGIGGGGGGLTAPLVHWRGYQWAVDGQPWRRLGIEGGVRSVFKGAKKLLDSYGRPCGRVKGSPTPDATHCAQRQPVVRARKHTHTHTLSDSEGNKNQQIPNVDTNAPGGTVGTSLQHPHQRSKKCWPSDEQATDSCGAVSRNHM